MNKIWKFVIYVNVGVFFQFYCKVLLFDGLTALPPHWTTADQDEPLTWSSKPINFLLHINKERSILSGGHIHQLPMPKTQDSSIQLPKYQSFPDGCFVWLLGYLYFLMIKIIIKIIKRSSKNIESTRMRLGMCVAGDHLLDPALWTVSHPTIQDSTHFWAPVVSKYLKTNIKGK